jgi:L-fuconolactonase
MPAFPIIDSHLHIWDKDSLSIPWLPSVPALNRSITLGDYDAACGAGVVEGMVFVECDVDPAQALAEAQWVSEQARRDKRIQAIIPHAPLEQGDSVLLHLEQLAEMKLVRGVRRLLQSEPDAEFCLRPRFVEAVRLLSRFGWSFDICITYRQMDSVIRLADLCPAVPMVLDHLGKPNIREGMLEPWRTQMAELARRENVVCKLSGVATEADHSRWDREELKPFMEAALSAFGPKRLMFGGDWPVSTQAISYRGWLDVVEWVLASLSVSELTSVFRDGARAFYRLP